MYEVKKSTTYNGWEFNRPPGKSRMSEEKGSLGEGFIGTAWLPVEPGKVYSREPLERFIGRKVTPTIPISMPEQILIDSLSPDELESEGLI